MRCAAGCGRAARCGVTDGTTVTLMLCWVCAIAAVARQAALTVRELRPRPGLA